MWCLDKVMSMSMTKEGNSETNAEKRSVKYCQIGSSARYKKLSLCILRQISDFYVNNREKVCHRATTDNRGYAHAESEWQIEWQNEAQSLFNVV